MAAHMLDFGVGERIQQLEMIGGRGYFVNRKVRKHGHSYSYHESQVTLFQFVLVDRPTLRSSRVDGCLSLPSFSPVPTTQARKLLQRYPGVCDPARFDRVRDSLTKVRFVLSDTVPLVCSTWLCAYALVTRVRCPRCTFSSKAVITMGTT